MEKLKLQRGMIFCTSVQKIQAKDNESTYSHSGIIVIGGDVKEAGTFEALWTNHQQHFYSAYKGKRVLIGRHKDMNLKLFLKGWGGIRHHEGKIYAGWRLPLFFIPFLAKYLSLGLGVCSELTMKFLFKAGLAPAWKGWNPDDVADMIHNYRDYEIVYEGILDEKT